MSRTRPPGSSSVLLVNLGMMSDTWRALIRLPGPSYLETMSMAKRFASINREQRDMLTT